MKELVDRINEQYGLGLNQAEILQITQEAENADRLFQQLFIDDINGIMPLPIVSHKKVDK